ncbi:MAG TPA: hypothetical protein VF899_19205 [Pyrinomonadaceae bacterium]
MQTEINFESPNLLVTKNSDGAQGKTVVTLGGILKFALFFIICVLVSILTAIFFMITGWVLGDLGLG